jgi:hypothetical protein
MYDRISAISSLLWNHLNLSFCYIKPPLCCSDTSGSSCRCMELYVYQQQSVLRKYNKWPSVVRPEARSTIGSRAYGVASRSLCFHSLRACHRQSRRGAGRRGPEPCSPESRFSSESWRCSKFRGAYWSALMFYWPALIIFAFLPVHALCELSLEVCVFELPLHAFFSVCVLKSYSAS